MKKIALLLSFLFCAFFSFAQFPNDNYISNAKTIYHIPVSAADLAFLLPNVDTTNNAATIYAGALTRWGGILWMSDGVHWYPFVSNNTGIFSDTVNVKFPLGVYIDSAGRQVIYIRLNGLFNGGIVSWSGSGLIFDVTSANYGINYFPYLSPTMQVTLAAAPTTMKRTDLFIVDTFALADKITGDSSNNPVVPQFNPTSQIGLTSVTLNAGDTVPSNINVNLIYNEGTTPPAEWDTTKIGTLTASFSNTDNPYIGTKAIFVSSYQSGAQLILTDDQQDTLRSGDLFKAYVYLNNAFTNYFQLQFFNGNSPVSNKLSLQSGFGLNPLDTNRYQTVVVPLNVFTFSSNFYNRIKITMQGIDTSGAGGFYLDYLQIQSGIYNPDIDLTNKVDSVNKNGTADTLFYWIKGVAHFAGTTGGSGGAGTVTNVTATNNYAQTWTITNPSTIPNLSLVLDTTLFSTRLYNISIYQPKITLTTTGTSGASTLTGATLNIPQYTTDISGKLNISDTSSMLANYLLKTNITAGTNITLTGVGSTISPYVINSSGSAGIDSIRKKGNFQDSIVQYSGPTGTFDFRTLQLFNIKDYGARADGVTDNTTAIQNTINAAITAGGGTIYIPYDTNTYVVSGALQTSISGVNPNCQIYIPLVAISGQLVFIRFLGGTPPNVLTPGFAGGGVARNRQGVIIESTINGTGTLPSVFGTPWQLYTGWGYRNGVYVTMENMVIRTRTKTLAGVDTVGTMSAVNFSKLGNYSRTNVKADISSILLNMVQPTAETYGFIDPNLNNGNVGTSYGTTMIEGYKYGLVIGEHGNYGSIVTVGCVNGIVVDSMYHSATIQSYCPENVIKNIYMRGNGQLDITSMSTEHYTTGWWANTHDVYFETPPIASGILIYPANLAYISKRRVHIANYTQVSPSVGDSILFVTNDSTNVYVDHFNNASATEAIQYPATAAVQNINLLVGNQAYLQLTANTVVNLSKSFFGKTVTIFAKQDVTGSRTLTVQGTVIGIDATASAVTRVIGTNTALGWVFSTASSGSSVSSGWSITGNTGLTANTNFLGTTDAQSILFVTNGIPRAKIDSVGKMFIDSVYIGAGGGVLGASAARQTNLAFGDSALFKNAPVTAGNPSSFNTAIGNFTLARDSVGLNNTAVGYAALRANKNATGLNTAVGSSALTTNTTGNNNTAVGANALNLNTTASFNVAIGSTAMGANTTGGTNVAVGSSALAANTTGTTNTAVGYEALLTNISTGFQAALGYRALRLATGERNTAVGSSALTGLTSGYSNIGIGESALYQATTGHFNTRIGAEYNYTTAIAGGNSNTYIGANTRVTAAESNWIRLNDGEGWEGYTKNSNRQSGIGNRNPTATLQPGAGRAAQFGAPFKFTYWNLATTNATQSGVLVTLTFATQFSIPFSFGDTIVVAGITPAGYNGTWPVISSTTTTVTYNTTAGLTGQTVAGTIKTGDLLLTTAEAGAMEYDGTRLTFTNSGGQRQDIPQIQETRVSTQFDAAGTTTLANITGLTATLVAGKTYFFEAILHVTKDAVGGEKYAMAGTSTATNIIYEILAVDNSGNLNTITSRQTALAGSAGQASGTTGFTKITGTITVDAAGTLVPQFSQNAAVGTSSILVGSTFLTRQIP